MCVVEIREGASKRELGGCRDGGGRTGFTFGKGKAFSVDGRAQRFIAVEACAADRLAPVRWGGATDEAVKRSCDERVESTRVGISAGSCGNNKAPGREGADAQDVVAKMFRQELHVAHKFRTPVDDAVEVPSGASWASERGPEDSGQGIWFGGVHNSEPHFRRFP